MFVRLALAEDLATCREAYVIMSIHNNATCSSNSFAMDDSRIQIVVSFVFISGGLMLPADSCWKILLNLKNVNLRDICFSDLLRSNEDA